MSFFNEPISATYQHGSRIILNTDWHDKNIICPNSKIYYVIDGELCVEAESKKLVARAGDAILIPAGVKHSYYLTELGFAEKYWFHFDLRTSQNNFFDTIGIPRLKHLGINSEIYELFERILAIDTDKPRDRLAGSAALFTLISLYIGDCRYKESTAVEVDETDRVISYIKKNYFEGFTLERLASMANLSQNYLVKKFKERVGLPPLKYINTLRVERAKFLLEHSKKSVNSIMEEVGFWDSAHFSKLFKSETGFSPSKFRKALTSGKERKI